MSSFFYGGHHQHQPQSQQHQQHHQHHNPHQHHHHHQQQQQQQQHNYTQNLPSHTQHGRSRRAPRPSTSQNPSRQYRSRPIKDLNTEAPHVTAFRVRFEAGRSFDLDDDLEFCPYLLTDDDRITISSGSSDRSSLSSGSPNASPIQHQIQPQQQVTPSISLSSNSSAFTPADLSNTNNQAKIHQPCAVRTRNAIPIVNPTTGMRIESPPSSISPGMMQHTASAPRW